MAVLLSALCSVALAFTAGCESQEAILLLIRPPSGVQLSQYEVKIQDRASRTLVYQSGIQPVTAVTSGRDLFIEPLRVGLKLSKSGSFLVFVRAAVGPLAPEGSKPQQRTSEYFFAALTQTAGTTEINGTLLEVTPDYDKDFDHFPDAVTWLANNFAAKVQYQGDLEVLDCVDRDPGPTDPQLPAGLYASQINPLAKPLCGLAIDVSCGPMAPVCKDADGDGENEATDCDDSDPKRFHGNPRPRNCCTCTDHTSCATDHSKLANQAVCQPARCDDPFDWNCTGQVVSCFVDEDCDGYSPNDPSPSQRDCDDTNPDVYPGAPKKCADPTHDWACDGNPRGGCVTCDLDGDGYQRKDAICPDATDIHPGQVDCDDNDRGVFPGSSNYAGATLIISDLKKNEGGGSVAAALRRLCANLAVDGKTAQDADCDGQLRLGCPPAMAAGKVCDADGDGFPNANAGCNPGGLALDCDDTKPTFFPGAPDKCGDGLAQNCNSDTACNMDKDGDGYNSDVDCDDNNAARHPWATELCNGVDDDCDGLIDEMNPDNQGGRMVETHGAITSVLSCTDYSLGDCNAIANGGFHSGRCVCTGLVPGKHAADPGRLACPGTREDATTAPKCFGAIQPGRQTCVASTPKDEDCDGRTDAPEGTALFEATSPCGTDTGPCTAGKVKGCDRTKINPFSKMATPSFSIFPPFNEERRFLVCDPLSGPVYPSVELCNDNVDNDCNNVVEDCSGAGIKTPKCCLGVNMCIDLDNTFAYCGSCTGACNLANASACVGGACKCGTLAACTGTRKLCKGSASCVQCLLDTDCTGATPRCKGADTCVQCLSNADCDPMSANPACNTTTNTCVPCFANSDCKDPMLPVCDTAGGYVCRQCVSGTDCSTAKPICDTAGGHVCRECLTNAYCKAKDPTKPVCDAGNGYVCNCAVDGDCSAPTPQCDAGAGLCRACVTDTYCKGKDPTRPVCDAGNGYVCDCKMDGDCTAPTLKCDPTPTPKQCVQCLANGDCAAPTPLCKPVKQTCVECLGDTDCAAVTGKHKCETTTSNSCVACLANADCVALGGGLTTCNTTAHTCS